MRLPSEEGLHFRAHGRDARGTSDEHDLVDLGVPEARVRERPATAVDRAFDEVGRQAIELFAGEPAPPIEAELGKGEVHLGLGALRQLDLAAFGREAHGLLESGILDHLGSDLRSDLGARDVDESTVEVVSSEVRVTRRGEDAEHSLLDREHGHVERASSEVVHGDVALLATIESVGEARGRGLVDDP